MSLSHNLVRLGVLLFAFGAVTGLLLAASFGTRTGTVLCLILVFAALGLLLQSNQVENTDDEAEPEEDDAKRQRIGDATLLALAQIIYGLIIGSVFFWAIMAFITYFFGYEFERNTWLLPPIFGLLLGCWAVIDDQAASIKHILEQRAKGNQDE